MDRDSYRRQEGRRITQRLKQVPRKAKRREHSERAHLQQLRQLLRELDDERYAEITASPDVCVYCGIGCAQPVLISAFPVPQQMVWDALHQHYTEAVARVFFAQMVNDLEPDDEEGWMARLERITS